MGSCRLFQQEVEKDLERKTTALCWILAIQALPIETMEDNIWCCIATGPSLTVADCERVRACGDRVNTIVINDNYRIAPWARHLYACDGRWWAVHKESVFRSFSGSKWTQDPGFKDDPAFNFIRSIEGTGLADDALVQGNNSGYQAINLAYVLGASRVILLGYDMRGQGEHWFGRHDQSKGLGANTDYSTFVRHFEQMQPQDYGLEVINCSRESALECFPRMRLREALAAC